jgi:hypothetical protein
MDLALAAGISARHMSFIETGRSRPGREPFALPPNSCVRMVVRGGSAHSLGGPSSTSKCRGFARVRLLRAIFVRDVPLVALLAASWGTYLHWPALTNPLRFDNNWRQAPHWISPDRRFFHPDDAMLRFAEYGTSWFADLLYQTLALTGHDIIWGKINAILFFTAFVTVALVLGRSMGGRLMGWTAAVLLMFFPNVFREFGGGFMDGLSASLLVLTILLIAKDRWVWAIPLIAFQSLQYPMVAIQSGMIFLVDALVHDRRRLLDPAEWRRKYGYLAAGAVVMGLIIGFKYLGSHEFGELATRATMQDLPQFRPGARSVVLPVPPLWFDIEGRLFDPFHLLLFLVAYGHLGKNALRLPRGLVGLLLGSIAMYAIADVFLFRFYFPNRYVHFSFPLFVALAGGYWVCTIVSRVRATQERVDAHPLRRYASVVVAAVVLLFIGVRDFDGELRPGLSTRTFEHEQLYEWVRQLPGRPMIAAHPLRASDIPVIAGRSVFIMQELSQSYWSEHWALVDERTKAFFTAYYATDPDVIVRFIEKHGIDYWVIQPTHFSAAYLEGRTRFAAEPFNLWVREQLGPTPDALLGQLPETVAGFTDGLHLGLSSTDLIEWLRTQ